MNIGPHVLPGRAILARGHCGGKEHLIEAPGRKSPREDGEAQDEPKFEDELVNRLRTMEWPSAPSEVKERCFRAMQEHLAQRDAQEPSHDEPSDRADSAG